MPYTQDTLSDLQQSLADRHESNGTLPTSSAVLSFWTRILNRAVLYCTDRLRLNIPESLTTSSGTVACPAYFLIVNEVYDSSDNVVTQISEGASSGATGKVFWITGNHRDGFYFNVPTDNDDTYTVNMAFKPTKLVNNTDVCIIPDPEAVVAYAYAYIRKAESDPFEDADRALAECDSRLSEMQSAYSINSNSIGFTSI